MAFILTIIGTLLLLLSLAGIAFGAFMAVDRNTREAGWLFALGWVPAVAAASGVLMRDAVTFAVGLLCFLVAGAVFTLEGKSTRRPSVRRRSRTPRGGESLREGRPDNAEKPTDGETPKEETPKEETTEGETPKEETTGGETMEDKPGGYGRAAS